jgi:hydrogenase expression/formation protein HypD
MHVCGTHQDTLIRYGLDPLLRSVGVEVRAGPGCPVCVTTGLEFEEAIALAESGKIIATFGDVARAPGFNRSLFDAKADGCTIQVVYGIKDAVDLALKKKKDVVFMAVGFETTAPSTAATLTGDLPDNFYVLSCHRIMPPAILALLKMGEIKLDGLIEPGHVSTIIGLRPYEAISSLYSIPQVVAGFEPLDLLMAIYMLSKQVIEERTEVENEYSRIVKPDGNKKAQQLIDEVFESSNVAWRSFPVIKDSGLRIRSEFEKHDARYMFRDELEQVSTKFSDKKEAEGCRCGDVLRGVVDPHECPLFGETCKPRTPIGPCMVSVEGTCYIRFRYGEA